MSRRAFFVAAFATSVFAAATAPVHASSSVAARVVSVEIEGTVMGRQSAWQGGVILTRSTVRVDRVMRGTAPAIVEVTELGGRVGDIAQVVHRQPMMPVRPRVTVELAPVGQLWRLLAVLVPADPEYTAKSPEASELAAAGVYVRTTNKDSDPPCEGDIKEVSWPTANVHFVLDDACSSDVALDACDASVTASFQTWQDVPCAYLGFTYDGRMVDAPIGYDRSAPSLNVVKWIESDWPGSPEAQAMTLATIGCTSGRLLDADVLLNGESGVFTTSPVEGEGLVDIQNTVTHEVGHLAGFGHAPDPESTMFVTASVDETKKRDLTSDDEQGLCDVYPVGGRPGDRSGCSCNAAGRSTHLGGIALAALLALSAAARSLRKGRRAEATQLAPLRRCGLRMLRVCSGGAPAHPALPGAPGRPGAGPNGGRRRDGGGR